MKNNDFIIRRETKNDYREVENLAREAFWNLSEPGCFEHYFIHIMREHEDFIPELDYVIELDGKIIGSIMYCKSMLRDENGNEKHIVTMGPLCVLPEYQRKGYGKALLKRLAQIARGYKSCRKYNVCFEGDIFPAALLVKVLKEDALDGRKWFYYPSDVDKPCDDTKAVEEFDKLFPPKEKGWQPSQEEFYIHSHSVIDRE